MGGGGSKEADVEMSKIFGARLRDILKRMQKAVLLCSMNIAPTLKVILKYNTAIDPDFKCCNIDRGRDKP